jgi:hypothetical protein
LKFSIKYFRNEVALKDHYATKPIGAKCWRPIRARRPNKERWNSKKYAAKKQEHFRTKRRYDAQFVIEQRAKLLSPENPTLEGN